MTPQEQQMYRVIEFERLFKTYVDKLARLDELQALGRHGYQLRMPKKALRVAAQRLHDFGRIHNVDVEPILKG